MLQLASVTSTKPPKYQSSQLPLWCQVESQWNTLLHFTNKSHSERRRSAFLCPPEAHKLSLVASMALCHLNLLVLGGYSSQFIIIISSGPHPMTFQQSRDDWSNPSPKCLSNSSLVILPCRIVFTVNALDFGSNSGYKWCLSKMLPVLYCWSNRSPSRAKQQWFSKQHGEIGSNSMLLLSSCLWY